MTITPIYGRLFKGFALECRQFTASIQYYEIVTDRLPYSHG